MPVVATAENASTGSGIAAGRAHRRPHPDTLGHLSGSGQSARPDSRTLSSLADVADTTALTELNLRFIEAFRQGSWELLEPILSPSFAYLDGATGEVWEQERYIENLRSNPSPALAIDQVVVHVDGNTAVVSARTSRPGRHGRYVDTYERREHGWLCVHACVWPLHEG
jgi:hypothetical protein